jgi:hypothetical protein
MNFSLKGAKSSQEVYSALPGYVPALCFCVPTLSFALRWSANTGEQ